MTTNYCPDCLVNWAPYMTDKGTCIECGGGTVRRREPVDADAVDRHHKALKARADRERIEHLHAEFEAYYVRRETRALVAELDQLTGLDAP